MFNFKELILLYITIMGFVSYLPQIIQLLKTKNATGISIGSWIIWTFNSALYLLYLILSTENIWLILSQVLELSLIGSTLLLVLLFNKFK